MFSLKNRLEGRSGLAIIPAILLLVGFLAIYMAPVAMAVEAGDEGLSEYFAINIDPKDRKKIGEETYQEIVAFFHKAEKAIEREDLNTLMSLYSDGYSNGDRTKREVETVWKRLFAQFDLMATIHNMRFITKSKSPVMVIRCSGLLVGNPANEKNLITIDNWTNNDHILAKENGKWKLVGTAGKEQKRFWFDKAMHPLF